MVCSKEHCTGCLACVNICNNKAINIITNEYGFVYPEIDDSKCVKCGLCEKVCPELNKVNRNKKDSVYAVIAKKQSIHKKATSGGLATVISRKIIENGGIVYGHGFDENFNLQCMRITNIKDLNKICGTKYLQSDMNDSILKMKSDLKSGKKVLFIGTPCQVAGISNMLARFSNDLYTVSFVCGGVPSQKFFKENMNKYLKNVTDIKFRNNNMYGFYLYKDDELMKEINRWKSEFFIGFDEHAIQRESCYNCIYADAYRCGDLTIGDFWGLKDTSFQMKDLNFGVSLAIPTTGKGEKLIKICEEDLFIEKHNLAEAILYNPRLQSPTPKTINVDKFRNLYIKYGFDKAIRKIFGIKYKIYVLKSKLKKSRILDYIYHKFVREKNENNLG